MLIPVSAYNVYIVRECVRVCLSKYAYFRVYVEVQCTRSYLDLHNTRVFTDSSMCTRVSPLLSLTRCKSAQWKRCRLNRLTSLQFVSRVVSLWCHTSRLVLMSKFMLPGGSSYLISYLFWSPFYSLLKYIYFIFTCTLCFSKAFYSKSFSNRSKYYFIRIILSFFIYNNIFSIKQINVISTRWTIMLKKKLGVLNVRCMCEVAIKIMQRGDISYLNLVICHRTDISIVTTGTR